LTNVYMSKLRVAVDRSDPARALTGHGLVSGNERLTCPFMQVVGQRIPF
jgi:hypothetical protein